MNVEPLTIEHQSLLKPLFKSMSFEIAEYSFANIFLFRKTHRYEVIQGDDIYIAGITYDGFKYIMPTIPIVELNREFLKSLLNRYDFLFPIPEEYLTHFNSAEYQWTYNDADSDYIYSVDKLRYYPGRHLDGRRNLVRQFNEKYPDHHSYPLDKSRLEDAKVLLHKWKDSLKPDVSYADYEPCLEALTLLETLGLCGWIVYDDSHPVALSIGEWLTPEMYVIHFAKALIEYKGVYQFLYEDTALHINVKTRFINLEQDLGIESLRRSKEAYQPDKKLLKMRVQKSP